MRRVLHRRGRAEVRALRQLYLDLLRRRPGRALRACRSVLRTWRGKPQPLLATLVVTYRCDLDCAMCDLPLRGDRKREFDTEGLKGVLDGFVDLGVLGVGITGGEPLLRGDLLEIVRHGAARGLLMHVNTNGTLVTAALARGLAAAGVASVNVSLDGPDAALHDRLRGRDGSFARVLRAVARLVAVPARPYRVALTCALGEQNAGDARALLERGRDLGADRVGFVPVHDFPANGVARAGTNGALEELAARAGRDAMVDNSRAYLELFCRAYRGERNPVPCAAPRTSVVVDCYGDVFPCVPLNATRQGVGTGDVRDLWRSETYRRVRASLRDCRACFWNCHTELNLALRKLGGRP